jgi:hypothetical protein
MAMANGGKRRRVGLDCKEGRLLAAAGVGRKNLLDQVERSLRDVSVVLLFPHSGLCKWSMKTKGQLHNPVSSGRHTVAPEAEKENICNGEGWWAALARRETPCRRCS